MRIGLLTGSFLPRMGGLQWKVHFLATAYQRCGHEVTVFSSATRPGLAEAMPVEPTYRIVRCGLPSLPGFGRLGLDRLALRRAVLREHRRQAFDAFHCHHLGSPTAVGATLRESLGLPVVATTCGDDIICAPEWGWGYRVVPTYDRLVRANVRRVDVVGAISRAARRELEAIGTTARIVDIPNGVDWENFQVAQTRWLHERLGLSPEAVVVLWVGRNSPEKDFASGVRAFEAVAREFPALHGVFAGPNTESLPGLAGAEDIRRRLHALGPIPISDVAKALWSSDVFFLTSLFEGFPQVAAQAMACARACIVTDCSGAEDLAGLPGVRVVPRRDVPAMAHALRELVGNPAKRTAMGQANHVASRRYDWSAIATEYLGILEELVATRDSRRHSGGGIL